MNLPDFFGDFLGWFIKRDRYKTAVGIFFIASGQAILIDVNDPVTGIAGWTKLTFAVAFLVLGTAIVLRYIFWPPPDKNGQASNKDNGA